jgi:hypothetical protein
VWGGGRFGKVLFTALDVTMWGGGGMDNRVQ